MTAIENLPKSSDGPLGLIAGQGQLPITTARGMRAAGRRVVCAALAGQTLPELRGHCDTFKTVGLIRINQWIRTLKRQGCTEAVMVGRVAYDHIYQPNHLFRFMPDWRTARVWFSRLRHDRRSDHILRAVADELESGGITLIDGRPYVPESLAIEGVMTQQRPTAGLLADIEFGWPLLRRVNELLIGQSIAVKDKGVIAVEAVEGTDRLIERAGALCKRGGWVLFKASNPNQDMRFDVPTVGMATIENIHKHGGVALVVEAGRTIMLERELLLRRAEQLGITIVGKV